MFADALLDSHQQSRRGWATLTSFGIQAIFIACLLILPLLYTQVLPHVSLTTDTITVPLGAPPVVHNETARNTGGTVTQNPVAGRIRMPSSVPSHIDQSAGSDSLTPTFTGGGPYTGIVGDAPPIGIIGATGNGRVPVLVRQEERPPIRVSVIMEGSLIHRVEPVYPVMAKAARIQGTVLLQAVIGKDGTVQNLQIVSGPPVLVRAAREAVLQWRYRPYILNGSPIEVDTQISVNFRLAQ